MRSRPPCPLRASRCSSFRPAACSRLPRAHRTCGHSRQRYRDPDLECHRRRDQLHRKARQREAAVPSPRSAPWAGRQTTFTDTGLTNGTTYYYVVTGSNSAGIQPQLRRSFRHSSRSADLHFFGHRESEPCDPRRLDHHHTRNVKDTANTLTNGVVQILVLDPTGATALTQNFTGQNFTSGQSHPYQLSLVPSLAGTYTVEIGVFSSTYQYWNWNSSAANNHRKLRI